MYGQTEATARMAYLPPALAAPPPAGDRPGDPRRRTSSCGRSTAMPDGVGELVYRGPNVMLGYATDAGRPRARARRSTSWRPATSAATTPTDGVFEVVGRRSRFVKPFGLRIDLDAVEADLAGGGHRRAWPPATTSGSSCARRARSPDDVRAARRRPDRTARRRRSTSTPTRCPAPPAGKVDYDAVLAPSARRRDGAGGRRAASRRRSPRSTPRSSGAAT